MAELLPCPFCGSKNVCCGDAGCNNFWYVQCDDCFATFPHFDTKQEALDAWNTRAPKERGGEK